MTFFYLLQFYPSNLNPFSIIFPTFFQSILIYFLFLHSSFHQSIHPSVLCPSFYFLCMSFSILYSIPFSLYTLLIYISHFFPFFLPSVHPYFYFFHSFFRPSVPSLFIFPYPTCPSVFHPFCPSVVPSFLLFLFSTLPSF